MTEKWFGTHWKSFRKVLCARKHLQIDPQPNAMRPTRNAQMLRKGIDSESEMQKPHMMKEIYGKVNLENFCKDKLKLFSEIFEQICSVDLMLYLFKIFITMVRSVAL